MGKKPRNNATTGVRPVPPQARAGIGPAGVAPAVALVVVSLSLAAVPRAVGPLAALIAAAAVLAALGAWLLVLAPSARRREATLLGAAAIPVALLGVSATAALSPRIALAGFFNVHAGLLFWLVVLGWGAVLLLWPARRTSEALVAGVAISATLLAAAGLADWLGLLGQGPRWSPEPAGLFENSNSLGQAALLGVGACAALALSPRMRRYRAAWAGAGAICLAALLVSASRGSVAGLAAGVVAAVFAWRAPAVSRRAALAWVGALVTGALGALVLVASGALGEGVYVAADRLLNGRVGIWHAAVLGVAGRPLFGKGPSMFAAWYQWSPDPSRLMGVDMIGTYDPHGLLVGWLVAGGVLGALAATAALAWLGSAAVERVSGARSPASAALLGTVAGWLLTAQLEYVPVVVAIAASALLAALLRAPAAVSAPRSGLRPRAAAAAAGDSGPDSVSPVRSGLAVRVAAAVPAAGAVLAGVVAVALLAPLVASELRLVATDPASPPAARYAQFHDAYAATGDPFFAGQALAVAAASGDASVAEQARALAVGGRIARRLDPTVAAMTLALWAGPLASDPSSWERVREAADDGRVADPGTSAWDYLLAQEARHRGDPSEAAGYAETGARRLQPAANREALLGLAR